MRSTEESGLDLDGEMRATRARVDLRLDELLAGGPAGLLEAMRYAVLGGGKRLRPILCLWTYDMIAPDTAEPVLDVACGLEFLHTYSLVHDDLPCMDDDDLRRGRPTCHRRFGEATAVLAGDALLNLSYETVLRGEWHEPAIGLECARVIAGAASHRELVGGQALDLEAEGRPPRADLLEVIHAAKTGALMRAAVLCGAIAAGAGPEAQEQLGRAAQHLGLAFQIVDDVLDVVGGTQQLGKTPGKDASTHKLTFPAVYGLDASRARAHAETEAARRVLAPWPRSTRMRALATWIETRLG
jgi:geranylgeranyl diphosphate synthase type II